MSEIRTISQGNYILQGTVATSAGIVGDGTSQNPLRADETVLYSGSSANPTLSESIDNFEHIKVTYTYWPDNYATKVIYGWSAKPTFTDGWFNANGGTGGIFITRLTANDSHTVIGADANKYWNPPAGASLNDALSNFKVLEVIGVNRIGG